MTVVIVLSDCPTKLRGDMSKWFLEINTGVYVGNVSARVRDEIWSRILENIRDGRATMVFGATGEQHMDFRVHNARWCPKEYDGIKLMFRPARLIEDSSSSKILSAYSNASKHRMAAGRRPGNMMRFNFPISDYVVLDFETTGLDESQDDIIEIGALLVERGRVSESMQCFVRCDRPLPQKIEQLTGISERDLLEEGVALNKAIEMLRVFAEDLPFVCHNAAFEAGFLSHACEKVGFEPFENRMIDTVDLARRLLPDMSDYKLGAIAEYFEVPCPIRHRAAADCETTYGIYTKLIKLASDEMRNNEK